MKNIRKLVDSIVFGITVAVFAICVLSFVIKMFLPSPEENKWFIIAYIVVWIASGLAGVYEGAIHWKNCKENLDDLDLHL